MLTEQQIQEIRTHLEQCLNPLFFFDDDHDGLASYLLLMRRYRKGKGVCVKAALHDEEIYLKKIQQHKPDKIIFLDRAVLSQELLDHISVPVLWIDHHQPLERERVLYYNPMVSSNLKDNRPTSHWCYLVSGNDQWIAAVGIVGDWHVPDFLQTFEYVELLDGKKTQPELLFESRIGKLVKIFNFILKGQNSESKKCINLLLKIDDPYEILEQKTARGTFIYKRFQKVDKLYEKLLQKALATKYDEHLYLFKYPSIKMSFTADLANELLYRVKSRLIIIAREKGDDVRISLRSTRIKVLPVLRKALEGIEGHGGGHDYACGAHVKVRDFASFIEQLRQETHRSLC